MTRTSLLSLILLLPASLGAQASAGVKLSGAWKVVEITVTGDAGYTNTSPQPGFAFFTGTHYSVIQIQGQASRPKYDPAKDPAHLSDVEKLARYEQWNLFTANAGTYETRGDTLTYLPLAAKSESTMAGGPQRIRYKLDGSALWLIVPRTNGGETRTKLTRVD